MRRLSSLTRSVFGWRRLAPLACAFALATCASACQSNADKIEAFCTDMQTAVEENQQDCDELAGALDEVLRKHEGVKTFGTADGEEVQVAMEGCEQGARIIAAKCANHEGVTKVLQRLEDD